MPLNQTTLKQDIKGIFQNAFDSSADSSPEDAIDTVAEELANRIVEEIKKLTITIQPSTIIVSGSPTTQTNVAPIIISNSVT